MDREPTPLKQRQKRSGSAGPRRGGAAATNDGPTRAFRSSQPRQRSASAKALAPTGGNVPAPSAILAKPPMMILRAPAGSPPPTPPPAPTMLLHSDAPRAMPMPMHAAPSPLSSPPSSNLYQPRGPPMLRVNTSHAHDGPAHAAPSAPMMQRHPSPHGVPPQPLKRPSHPGHPTPSPVLLRAPAGLPPVVTRPASSVRVIHPNGQFAGDLLSRLGSCLDLTNFTVVGALGFQGTGKSTLLSVLATKGDPKPLASIQDLHTLRDRTKHPFFPTQPLEALLNARTETQGVDVFVACAPKQRANRGGLVLVDTPSLLGSSLCVDQVAKSEGSTGSRYGALTPEQHVELWSVQLAVLLFSVCHYVIVPQSAVVDVEMIAFLRKVYDKMQQMRLPNVSGAVKDRHTAKLLIVVNGAEIPIETDDEQLNVLEHVLPPEWLYRERRLPTAGSTTPSPLWAFPWVDKSDEPSKEARAWRVTALNWSRYMSTLPNSPSFSSGGVHTLTLKEWLSNTARVWDSVKKSGVLTAEYSTRDHH
ncbi:hypothetical protein Poli38472_014109 [Pythium oligandrum]|uniref:Protein SMG9 n=1 Tax=Pythium oligandrum TaxID=41045 RepID=A0A8K1FPD1_PYTOL|nr:hypothetical protein Poli38472_014109 [Pythium oligandrum]|eukprot:TMW66797.1 hypothetical protein Poli38472_014109 [Pythium oligandrum]